MDQGVIYTLKSHYRRLVLQAIIARMEDASSASDFAKSISVLDAVNWINMAALKIKDETIVKCFKKAHFLPHSEEAVNMDEAEDNLNIISVLCTKGQFDMDATTYVNNDCDVSTYQTADSAIEIQKQIGQQTANDQEIDDDEDEELETDETPTIANFSDALKNVRDLQIFAANKNLSELHEHLCKVKECLEKSAIQCSVKQVKLTDLWKRNKI